MGREAAGVRGIKLGEEQALIALIVVGEGNVLTASATGYGKLTPLDDFPSHGRGGQGVSPVEQCRRLLPLVGRPALGSRRPASDGIDGAGR